MTLICVFVSQFSQIKWIIQIFSDQFLKSWLTGLSVFLIDKSYHINHSSRKQILQHSENSKNSDRTKNESYRLQSAAGGGIQRLQGEESESDRGPSWGGTPLQSHLHHWQLVWGKADRYLNMIINKVINETNLNIICSGVPSRPMTRSARLSGNPTCTT